MKQFVTITLFFLVNFSYASEPVISLFTSKGKEIKITSMTRSSSGYDIITAKGAKMFLPNSAIKKCVPGTGLIKKIIEQKSQAQIKKEKEKAVSIEFLKTRMEVLKNENLKLKTQIEKAKREIVILRKKDFETVDKIANLRKEIKDYSFTVSDLESKIYKLESKKTNQNNEKQSQKKEVEIDKSPQMQKQRKAFIDKLIRKGIFKKIEVPGNLPRLWVKPLFYALDYDDKETFVSVVYAYYFDGTNYTDTVRIIDSSSGKQVGTYSTVDSGLKMK